MAIVWELQERSATFTKDKREYSITWTASSSTLVSEYAVLNDGGAPAIFEAWDNDAAAYCDNVSCSLLDSTSAECSYSVSATYSTLAEPEEDPLDRPVQVSYSFTAKERPIDFDASGNPIVNSAKDPLDPTLQYPFPIQQITMVRNESSEPDYGAYHNKTNSGTFHGRAAGTVLFQPESASTQTEGGTTYWQVTFSFLYIPLGHKQRLIDAGYRDIDQKPFLENGCPVSSPVPMDGSGHRLDPGDDPVYGEWTLFPSTSFSGLGL